MPNKLSQITDNFISHNLTLFDYRLLRNFNSNNILEESIDQEIEKRIISFSYLILELKID